MCRLRHPISGWTIVHHIWKTYIFQTFDFLRYRIGARSYRVMWKPSYPQFLRLFKRNIQWKENHYCPCLLFHFIKIIFVKKVPIMTLNSSTTVFSFNVNRHVIRLMKLTQITAINDITCDLICRSLIYIRVD